MPPHIRTVRVTAPPPPSSATAPPISSSSSRRTTPRPTSRTAPGSKNLRWTAATVMRLLSENPDYPVHALADRVAILSVEMSTKSDDAAPLERNARRRVYDALKVMAAVGAVEKLGSSLRWLGVHHLRRPSISSTPSFSSSSSSQSASASAVVPSPITTPKPNKIAPPTQLPQHSPRLRKNISKIHARLRRKTAHLAELQRRMDAFSSILHRNSAASPSVQNKPHRYAFPLLFVRGRDPVAEYRPGREAMRVVCRGRISLFSETDIVCMLADRQADVTALTKQSPTIDHIENISSSPSQVDPHSRNHSFSRPTAVAPPPLKAKEEHTIQDDGVLRCAHAASEAAAAAAAALDHKVIESATTPSHHAKSETGPDDIEETVLGGKALELAAMGDENVPPDEADDSDDHIIDWMQQEPSQNACLTLRTNTDSNQSND